MRKQLHGLVLVTVHAYIHNKLVIPLGISSNQLYAIHAFMRESGRVEKSSYQLPLLHVR